MISTATIRTNNIKERKEKKNREKLLAGPGSEFSLVNPEDLELDYYDYNVTNAGAAPGSYLGMDPAYLVWIPPLDDGMTTIQDSPETELSSDTDVLNDDDTDEDDEEPIYEKILPNYKHIDPGSNRETPDDEVPPLPPTNQSRIPRNENDEDSKIEQNKNLLNADLNKITAANTFNENSSKLNSNRKSSSKYLGDILSTSHKSSVDSIQMQELRPKPKRTNYRFSSSTSSSASPVKVHSQHRYNNSNRNYNETKDNDTEKETAVVKSPSDNINQYYELDDIQFVDEESDENDVMDNTAATIRLGQCDNTNSLIAKQ